MRKFNYFLALCLLSTFASCDKAKEEMEMTQEREAEKTEIERGYELDEMLALASEPQRSQEEALAIARQLSCPSDGATLKSSSLDEFEVDVVISDKGPLTYSDADGVEITPVDTVLYVINRKDCNGFFLVSGDKRLPDVLGYTSDGHLDKDKVDDESGMTVFLSRLPEFYELSLLEFQARLDSLEVLEEESDDEPLTYKRKKYRYEYSAWVESSRSKNLVPVTWGQDRPYNLLAPKIGNDTAVTGCVATATAQLCASFRYPKSYNGLTYDWDLLTVEDWNSKLSNSQKEVFKWQVSHLFRSIGNKLGNDWGIEETGASTGDVRKVLKSMGYSNAPGLSEYDCTGVVASIIRGRPVIMSGKAERKKKGWWIFSTTVYKKGHAWICDGYMVQERIKYKIKKSNNAIVSSQRETRVLLHCNWGWYGTNNGYFVPTVFDSSEPILSDKGSGKINETTNAYQYNIGNILNIHP